MKYYVVLVDHLQDPYPDHEYSYELDVCDSYEEAVESIMGMVEGDPTNTATPEMREELTKNGQVTCLGGEFSYHIRDENWTPPVVAQRDTMKIRKITTGWVTQTFDTDINDWVSQEFFAGDEVNWEDENGETIATEDVGDALDNYLPFNMVQPPRNQFSANSKYVGTVTVVDPDSGLPVEVEIRKMDTGAMVGLDGSYLEQMGDEEAVYSPYDPGQPIVVPTDEE